jgi:hypothetical protein
MIVVAAGSVVCSRDRPGDRLREDQVHTGCRPARPAGPRSPPTMMRSPPPPRCWTSAQDLAAAQRAGQRRLTRLSDRLAHARPPAIAPAHRSSPRPPLGSSAKAHAIRSVVAPTLGADKGQSGRTNRQQHSLSTRALAVRACPCPRLSRACGSEGLRAVGSGWSRVQPGGCAVTSRRTAQRGMRVGCHRAHGRR